MINLVQIGGPLKDDPDLFDARSGTAGAQFTVIVNNVRYEAGSGPVLSPVFIRCVAWEDTAAVVARLGKGTVVLVTGQITQQEVTNAGKTERKTKVHALTVQVVKTPLADRMPPPDEYPG